MRQGIHKLANHIDNSILTQILIISITIIPFLVTVMITLTTNHFQALLSAISLSIMIITIILGIIICAVDITYKD